MWDACDFMVYFIFFLFFWPSLAVLGDSAELDFFVSLDAVSLNI